MEKVILSIIECILVTLIVWKIAIPTFFALAKTEVGHWAYFGLLSFILLFLIIEYASFKKNNCTWIASQILSLRI